MGVGIKGKGLSLSRNDIRKIWTYYKIMHQYKSVREEFKNYLKSNNTGRGEIDNRLAQVREVIYQINSFGHVKSRYANRYLTVSSDLRGGIKYGVKVVPYYGDENDYGSDGKLPYYWGDLQGETIKEYLERNQ